MAKKIKSVKLVHPSPSVTTSKPDGGLNLAPDRPLTRDQWLREAFPEWGTVLNREIEATKPPKNLFILWWLGGAGWWMKSAGGANLCMDQNAMSGGCMDY